MNEESFYLGTHRPNWLWAVSGVPLFVSYRQMRDRKSPFPKATTRYAVDSGGFEEIKLHGEWHVTAEEYVAALRRFWTELGPFDWAAPQDWMCEPWVIEGGTHNGQHYAGTGLSVEEHQRLTIDNFLELRRLAPDLPIIPVLQGWRADDYHRHIDMYAEAGIDLTQFSTVGVGSVCRRESTTEAAYIFETLTSRGLNLHGFGVKIAGLGLYADSLVTSDSLAWSAWARRDAQKGIRHCAKSTCANCLHYALAWRDKVLTTLRGHHGAPRQLSLSLYGESA